MEVTLYLATTPNGLIARDDGSTGWSAHEWKSFSSECRTAQNLIIGRRTFEVMRTEDEFKRLPRLDVVVLSRGSGGGS